MPFSGVSVNNPQEENPTAVQTPTIQGSTFGGNVLGSGSTDTTGGLNLSNILIYGAIALIIIFIIQRLED